MVSLFPQLASLKTPVDCTTAASDGNKAAVKEEKKEDNAKKFAEEIGHIHPS
jgi:hypothetical protein